MDLKNARTTSDGSGNARNHTSRPEADRVDTGSYADEARLHGIDRTEAELGEEDRKDGRASLAEEDYRVATADVQARTRTAEDKVARPVRQEL